MSMHVEWEDHARDLGVELLTREEALEELQPDGDITTPVVLVLSSGGGGALAIGGDRAELLKLARKIFTLVQLSTKAREVVK